jgi:hypothetical protein
MSRSCNPISAALLWGLTVVISAQFAEATETPHETGIAEAPQCSFCEPGTACFVDVAGQCPPSSVPVDNSDLCACNAGFFLVDKQCVTCTAGSYCPGAHPDATVRRRMLSETNYSGSDIEPCPPNSQSTSDAESGSMCLCNSGYTMSSSATNVSVSVANTSTPAPVLTFHYRVDESPRSWQEAFDEAQAVGRRMPTLSEMQTYISDNLPFFQATFTSNQWVPV